jgi:hypothetical protein
MQSQLDPEDGTVYYSETLVPTYITTTQLHGQFAPSGGPTPRRSVQPLQKSPQGVGVVAVREQPSVGGDARLDAHLAVEVVAVHLFALPAVPAHHNTPTLCENELGPTLLRTRRTPQNNSSVHNSRDADSHSAGSPTVVTWSEDENSQTENSMAPNLQIETRDVINCEHPYLGLIFGRC